MFQNDYDVLTAYEAMDYLGIGENSIYRLLKSGELGAFCIGRTWKIPRKELDKYIDKSVSKNLKG
ncbi:MAG: helix-turn-helix domain-containing protein [Ruminococcaceae bacterium]|nr:helix-turn-helix domain-containing protein [Oscillospiraceae bacterium]